MKGSEAEAGSILLEGWGARSPEVAWDGRAASRGRPRREKGCPPSLGAGGKYGCWPRLGICDTRDVRRYKGWTGQALKTWKFVEIWPFLIVTAKAVFISKIFRIRIQTHKQHSLPPLYERIVTYFPPL